MQIVIVGSGLGGLLTAIEASAFADVTVVTKSAIDEANTRYAQGGVAAAMWSDDSAVAHAADTVAAGAGLADAAAVAVLCTEGPARVRDLISLGVRFDRTGDELSRGLEAAHGAARILHAGGDATGLEIERALVAAVAGLPRVRVLTGIALDELIVESGEVVGVRSADGEQLVADAVVIASGGAGQLFAHTTNPAVATGDGVAAAWRAGAALADVEFYQFHPTALALPGGFLVSEAVRGEGAVLRNAAGERFMVDVHPLAELAPRDVVARGIATEMAAQGGAPVVLDASSLGRERLAARFPTIDAAVRRAGIDWSREPVPVTPAAHYWMGGIATDLDGRSTLPGLWAVGEAASTGVHGANRLASNSLLEAAVFAHRAAESIRRLRPGSSTGAALVRRGLHDEAARREVPPRDASRDGLGAFDRAELQQLMWASAGVQRSGEALAAASEILNGWGAEAGEDRNLLDLARVIVDAALAREESRGAHYRSDFPAPRSEYARRSIWAREGASAC